MSAFLIIKAKVTDPVAFRAYAQQAAALVARFGGHYRVLGGVPEVLEGPQDPRKIVVSEWPDTATARAFWNSPEYAAVRPLREGLGEFEVLLVEGIAEGNA